MPTHHEESVIVAATPAVLYDMIADVTRMGEWSPACSACWWDEGAGPRPGAWFTGRNETAERTWQTRSQVLVADAGSEFAWAVGGDLVRWGFTFAPAEGGGARLTESWDFLPGGLGSFRERYGPDADAQIADRTSAALAGIPVTLAAIKRAVEHQP